MENPGGWGLLLLLALGGGGLGGLSLGHALLELVDAAGGIHKFLGARIERVAHVADPDQDRRFG